MKKITSLLIGCSLALAATVMAQQPEDQQSPAAKANKRGGEKKNAQAAEVQTGANGASAEKKANRAEKRERRGQAQAQDQTKAQGQGQGQAQGAAQAEGQGQGQGQNAAAAGERRGGGGGKHLKAGKNQNAEATSKTEGAGATGTTGAAATTSTETGAGASVAPEGGKHPGRENRKAMRDARQDAKGEKANANAATGANTGAATSTSATTQQNTQVQGGVNTQVQAGANVRMGRSGKANRLADTQKLQQIRTQHASFRAQPRPDRAPAVTFNQNYRIEGSDRWQGQQYEAFRSYHPERHDQGWYRSHYRRVELVGGGYYYWNNGYWYPAWGYDPSSEYYAYDGPIYVGHRSEPPDQVIADVQAELQELGYYQGEVDGLVGPITRQALTEYQADQGLATTAAIDEPTLDSLGMNS